MQESCNYVDTYVHICHLVLHHRDYTPVTDFVTGDCYFYIKNYICVISSPWKTINISQT